MNSERPARIDYSKRGGVMIMTAAAAILIFGMAALVTDAGWWYYNRARLQTAINAGWKAGFDRMKEIQSQSNLPLTQDQKDLVTSRVIEVAMLNGYTAEEAQSIIVEFGPHMSLDVRSSQPVGMFFARLVDDTLQPRVAAARFGSEFDGLSIVPLAIPHGVVKDLSKGYYFWHKFENGQEFQAGEEYILKLGSGEGLPPDVDKKILVPMDVGDQPSDDAYCLAYGAAYWCLQIDANDSAFAPVEWLLGYRGGAFFLPHALEVINKLVEYGVNYEVIEGIDNINDIYKTVGNNVMEIIQRPRILVYSSSPTPDPVELVLRQAKIPYGAYSLPKAVYPGGWGRNEEFAAANCISVFDEAILSGELGKYHWLHLHHEDFTGFNGGCSNYDDTCKNFYDRGHLGFRGTEDARLACKNRMCSYCASKFDHVSGFFDLNTYSPLNSGVNNPYNCKNVYRRCAERQTASGNWWREDPSIVMCGSGYMPQCTEYQALRDTATNFGFTDDPDSFPKPQLRINTSSPLSTINPADPAWFINANRTQKMRFQLVNIIKRHVEAGGFLFAQCFAPETFELALWQSAIHDGETVSKAEDACLAFKSFELRGVPKRHSPVYFSTINNITGSSFALQKPNDPRCQCHGVKPDTGSGHTRAFYKTKLKAQITALGEEAGYVKYISGAHGLGIFTFLGGHYHNNVQAKRLVLDNVLFGATSEKELSEGGAVTYTGKVKCNYGPIDPDNVSGGGANDYRDRLKYGFNAPLQINDRVNTEGGNMVGPTNEGVEYRVFGEGETPPSRFVIIPITDIGPEVPINNQQNVDAETIHDLQGQDNSGGVYTPSQYDFGSSVRIIGFAMFELIHPTEYQRDGGDILEGDNGDLGPYQSGQMRGKFVKYVINPYEVQDQLN